MSQKVILISGNLKSGKSTIAGFVKEELAKQYTEGEGSPRPDPKIFSFASSIKNIARDHFDWDGKKDKKGRLLLQRLGTEVGRMYNEDIWVNKFSTFLEESCGEDDVIIVDDWRFENEYEKIEFPECGGDILKIRIRRESTNENLFTKVINKLKSFFVKKHASENSLPENGKLYDKVFNNYYESLDDLKSGYQFEKLLNEIKYFLKQ